MLVGQHPGDVGQQPRPVERLDLDGDQEHRGRGRRPLDLDHPLGLARRATPTLTQSARCTETPLPRVTKPTISSPGHRRAAAGQLDPDVVDALDDDARVGSARRAARPRVGRGGLGDVLGRALLAAERLRRACCTTDWAETWPSPTAAYSAAMSA